MLKKIYQKEYDKRNVFKITHLLQKNEKKMLVYNKHSHGFI